MNTTLWNSTEEGLICFSVGLISILVHIYAIVICFAVVDYQKEKPTDEKELIDVLLIDLMYAQIRLLLYIILTYNISLFSTPILYETLLYCVSYLGVLIFCFWTTSYFVTLCFGYVFVFHPDSGEKMQLFLNIRSTASIMKLLLCVISLSLSYILPSPMKPQPQVFNLMCKGKLPYKRWVARQLDTKLSKLI